MRTNSLSTPTLHVGRWWLQRQDGRIECLLCPRGCKLGPSQRGSCGVRHREGDAMVLDVYGLTSGLAIDPIEKKPLYHFLPGSRILSFGTPGCNLCCSFCQNWRLSQAPVLPHTLIEAPPEDIAQAALEEGCFSVAFTYNDPVIFAEYAIDAALACHEKGIRAVAVSAGYISDAARKEFFSVMDAANIDLKSFSDDFYRRYCRGRLQPVLDTLLHIKQEGRTWLEVTTLLIPGLNDSIEELDRASDWYAENLGREVPWHFSAFHPNYHMHDITPTPQQTLEEARALAMSKGLKYVYTGNIQGGAGSKTHCPRCGKLLIDRDGFRITRRTMQDSNCPVCGDLIAGCFS